MKFERALNIAIGCVMASALENSEKREVINQLRKFEEITELVEYREYDDSEIVGMIEKIINN